MIKATLISEEEETSYLKREYQQTNQSNNEHVHKLNKNNYKKHNIIYELLKFLAKMIAIHEIDYPMKKHNNFPQAISLVFIKKSAIKVGHFSCL